jgi:hypothetical protein
MNKRSALRATWKARKSPVAWGQSSISWTGFDPKPLDGPALADWRLFLYWVIPLDGERAKTLQYPTECGEDSIGAVFLDVRQ